MNLENKEGGKKTTLFCITYSFLFLLICISCKNNSKEDIEKLETLKKSYELLTVGESNSSEFIGVINKALEIDNYGYAALAYHSLANHYINKVQEDSSLYAIDQAINYYRKDNNKKGEIEVKLRKIVSLSNSNEFELALKEISALLEDTKRLNNLYLTSLVYLVHVNIYTHYGKYHEALEFLNKAEETFDKVDSTDTIVLKQYIVLMQIGAALHNLAGNYKESLEYCYKYVSEVNKEKMPEETKIKKIYMIISPLIIVNLVKLEKIEDAKNELLEYQSYSQKNNIVLEGVFLISHSISMIEYYIETGDYQQAIHYINILDKGTLDIAQTDYTNFLQLKSEVLVAQGKYLQALDIKDKLYHYTDSVHDITQTKQIETLKRFYTLEREAVEYDTKMKYIHIIIILLSLISISVITMFFIKLHDTKKLKKKNELLFAQYSNIDKISDEIVNLPHNIQNEESQNKEPSLFEKTENYLNETKYYLEPTLTRESLASKLGTNRQYLTEAIQESKNMTFMEYINSKKLEYARRLLSYDMNITIDEVYINSGFNSKSTFYRQFKQRYDLTPTEIREIAIRKISGTK